MLFLRFIILCAIFSFLSLVSSTNLKWAAVLHESQSYPWRKKVFDIAVSEVNNDRSILPNITLDLNYDILWQNSADQTVNLQRVTEVLFANPDISGIVGTYSSIHSEALMIVADILKIPIISSASVLPELADKELYPYFARLIGSSVDTTRSIFSVMDHSNFKRFAYFSTDNVYGKGLVDTIYESVDLHEMQLISQSFVQALQDGVSVTTIINEIDTALEQLRNSQTRVIFYHGHWNDIRLVLWRAFVKGMLGRQSNGTVYQWIWTYECNLTLFSNCPIDECDADMPAVMEAATGSLCASVEASLDEDWLNNIWKPNTTPDKLTQEEIDESGTDDWSIPAYWSAFGYDTIELFARGTDVYCTSQVFRGKYDDFDECIMDLPNREDFDLMDSLSLVSFEGATGHVQLDSSNEREMLQEVYEWDGDAWVKKAAWSPDKSGIGFLELSQPFNYATQNGIPPSTVEFQQLNSSVEWSILAFLFLMGIATIAMVICILQGRSSRKPLLQPFFSVLISCGILVGIYVHLVCQCLNAILTLSPSEDNVKFSIIMEYSCYIPAIIIFSVLSARLFRFYRVTRNSSHQRRKFSKHQAKYYTLMMMGWTFFWIFLRYKVDQSTEDTAFTSLVTLQDSNPYFYFTLTKPVYNLSVGESGIYLVLIVYGTVLLQSLAVFYFSYMCTHHGSKKTRLKIGKEMRFMKYFGGFCVLLISIRILIQFKFGLTSRSSSTHVGFENGNSSITLHDIETKIALQVITSIVAWLSGVILIYKTELSRCIKRCMFNGTFQTSESSSSNGSKTHHHSFKDDNYKMDKGLRKRIEAISGAKTYTLGNLKHNLDGDRGGTSSNTNSESKSHFVDPRSSASTIASRMYSVKKHLSSSTNTNKFRLSRQSKTRSRSRSRSHYNSSALDSSLHKIMDAPMEENEEETTTNMSSKNQPRSQKEINFGLNLSVGESQKQSGSLIYGSTYSYEASNTTSSSKAVSRGIHSVVEEFDAEEFIQDFGQLQFEDKLQVIQRIDGTVRAQIQAVSRLVKCIENLDARLQHDVLTVEVLGVISRRLMGKNLVGIQPSFPRIEVITD
eukprot:TRINITY_DN570587_c0_g1_i1.p1 TRINITY_DN570587_c0_g1~~TRINITY_DN570587_c0_g1_i1.p1  ORF type:complete len:1071 (-),score=199.19 TRINITY_DN570587_c0_g1_i1:587-3799(-)